MNLSRRIEIWDCLCNATPWKEDRHEGRDCPGLEANSCSARPSIRRPSCRYDGSDGFVAENYAEMRAAKLLSALVPSELGNGGLSYGEVWSLIRGFGRCCGSTALTFSMHQHLLAAALWNHRHDNAGENLLRAVADGEKVLVSTGATDWLASNGVLEACEGGYRFTAKKVFAPCAGADKRSSEHNCMKYSSLKRLPCRRSADNRRPVRRPCREAPGSAFSCVDGAEGVTHRPRLGNDGDARHRIAYGRL